MPSYLTIAFSVVLAYLSTFVYCFIRNLSYARKSGFPSIIVPWDQNHLIWIIISIPLRPLLAKWLPRFIYERLSLTIYGYEFTEKLRPFEQCYDSSGYNKTFMLVTCGRPEISTRDPEIVTQILDNPNVWCPNDLTELFMAKFGQNVLTSNGDSWRRQRKVVASVINERISKTVFEESIEQAKGMLMELEESTVDGVVDTDRLFDMAKKITINVLSGAGMGASVSWKDDQTLRPEHGFKQTYIQSVKALLDGITGPLLFPQWLLLNYPRLLPGSGLMQSIGIAVEEFPAHTTKMLDRERERSRANHSPETRINIMSQLVQASEEEEDPTFEKSASRRKTLSDEETKSNLFIFTVAGFDTTANTISYALVLLARFPHIQDWLLEEIDAVVPQSIEADPGYAETFPKLTRLLAFMLETLRLFTPLIHISKQNRSPQTIQTSKGTFWIPANTTMYVHAVGLHLDPALWSNLNPPESEQKKGQPSEDDASTFRPSRWINPPGSQQPLFQPPKGTFVPWSTGPRVCPGQKMAQVEFIAVFVTLLCRHRIDAVPLNGETRAQTDRRLDERMKGSISILTLQMENVYDIPKGSDKGLRLRMSRRS